VGFLFVCVFYTVYEHLSLETASADGGVYQVLRPLSEPIDFEAMVLQGAWSTDWDRHEQVQQERG